MKRDYDNGVKDNVEYFVGNEVEKTPAHLERTLFVVGTQMSVDVMDQARENDCKHIYLGANQSFNPTNDDQKEDWDDMIMPLLEEGWLVTLDYDIKYHEHVIAFDYNRFDNFISQISVKVPNIEKLNNKACIKIDDNDFKHSNKGVWIHHVKDLKLETQFTNWEEYGRDTPIKEVD
jgi:hypothetical protein|tara:strand:- start:679 stop:1206 length:528 start_codon:yes stop_codon:yes gene_type:complete